MPKLECQNTMFKIGIGHHSNLTIFVPRPKANPYHMSALSSVSVGMLNFILRRVLSLPFFWIYCPLFLAQQVKWEGDLLKTEPDDRVLEEVSVHLSLN